MSTVVYGYALLAGAGALIGAYTALRRLGRAPGRRRRVEDLRDTSAGEVGSYEYIPRAGNPRERVARLMRAMPNRHPEYLTARLRPADEAVLTEHTDVAELRQIARDVQAEGQV